MRGEIVLPCGSSLVCLWLCVIGMGNVFCKESKSCIDPIHVLPQTSAETGMRTQYNHETSFRDVVIIIRFSMRIYFSGMERSGGTI
jgi:hypothetical protein